MQVFHELIHHDNEMIVTNMNISPKETACSMSETALSDHQPVAAAAYQPKMLRRMILCCLCIAAIWWGVALVIRHTGILNVWTDQQDKFVLAATHFLDPYAGMSGFFSPPWAVIPLVPFELMPLSTAALLQAWIYFALLGRIAYGYHVKWVGLLAAMLSPLALDAILEINIDWIAAIGLVIPAQYSLIFLAVKPQAFPAYIFTLTRQQLIRAVIVLLLMMLVSFLIWGVDWLIDLYHEFGTRTLATSTSLSPWAWMPPLFSIGLGLVLLAYAFWKKDDVLTLLSGIFFTPYLPTYTAIIPFLFFCIRYPRAGAFISFGLWLMTLAILIPIFASRL